MWQIMVKYMAKNEKRRKGEGPHDTIHCGPD
jgi:hypothetical protein